MSKAAGTMRDIKLEMKRVLPVSAGEVYEAWTKPEVMQRWFAPGAMTVLVAEADLRVGGAYRVEMRYPDGRPHVVRGVYKEIVPNERLVFTWAWEDKDSHESQVSILLKSKGAETELTLIHERLANDESKEKHNHGWIGCLDKLADLWK